jgi:hypothetical protein
VSARPRILVHRGKRRTVAAWAALVGVPADRILQRINRYGWTITRALTTPVILRPRHDSEARRARNRACGKSRTWRRRDAGLCARCEEPSETYFCAVCRAKRADSQARYELKRKGRQR